MIKVDLKKGGSIMKRLLLLSVVLLSSTVGGLTGTRLASESLRLDKLVGNKTVGDAIDLGLSAMDVCKLLTPKGESATGAAFILKEGFRTAVCGPKADEIAKDYPPIPILEKDSRL